MLSGGEFGFICEEFFLSSRELSENSRMGGLGSYF